MADIAQTARKGDITDGVTARFASQFAGDNAAGEDITWGGACVELRPGGRNGQVFRCGSGVFAGVTHESKKAGQPTTVYGVGLIFHASDAGALTPGNLYYVSATPGRIADAPTAKDATGAFLAVSPYELQIVKTGKLV